MSSIFHRLIPYTISPPVNSPPENVSASPEPTSRRYPKRKLADVQYNYEDNDDGSSESELEYMPRQRTRTTKPLPQHKIFPFLSLPAELRNRIYEECLPSPTEVPEDYRGDKQAIWLGFRQRFYRKTIEYIPSVADDEELRYSGLYGNGRFPPGRLATQRGGRAANHHNDDDHSDSDAEGEHEAGPKKLGFNMLSVCKQIYEEAAPMMYNRTLMFTDVDALFAFAATLSSRTAKLLTSIEILTWGLTRSRRTRGYVAMAMLAAKGVTNLTRLFINCEMGYFDSYSWRNSRRSTPVPKRIAKKVYRDCHLWLEAVGTASGDLYKGVDILKLNGEMFDRGSGATMEELEDEQVNMYKKELKRLLREGSW
ncbi:hypothetical protein N0V90_000639 [Kalmusia sp. IMI 367209]|nr:hypothetical protein N0V90_000639 [Kalmusia sp. IMI 367209]